MESKKNLRQIFREQREKLVALNPDLQKDRGTALRDIFKREFTFNSPQIIAGYTPGNNEMDPLALLESLQMDNHTLCLPRTQGPGFPLTFHYWGPHDPLELDPLHKILIPCKDQPILEPTILLVPLLAFTRTGYRLGYGGGYYDRTLDYLRGKKDILTIGCAYAEQEARDLPVEPHDQRLDYILTDKELIKVI